MRSKYLDKLLMGHLDINSIRNIFDAFPANIRLDEDVLKTSFVFVFRRRLDQDEHIRYTHTSSKDIFKTSSRRLQGIFKTFSRRFEDVFKTSCKDVFKTLSKRIIKLYCSFVNKFSRRLQDVFTTFLRRTAKIDLYIYLDRSI